MCKTVYGVSGSELGPTIYTYEKESSAIASAKSLAAKNHKTYYVQKIDKTPAFRVGPIVPEIGVTPIGDYYGST